MGKWRAPIMATPLGCARRWRRTAAPCHTATHPAQQGQPQAALHRLSRVAGQFGFDEGVDAWPAGAGGGLAGAHLHFQQGVDLGYQRGVVRGVQRVLGQFGKEHGRHAALIAYPPRGQQRAQHVEVFL